MAGGTAGWTLFSPHTKTGSHSRHYLCAVGLFVNACGRVCVCVPFSLFSFFWSPVSSFLWHTSWRTHPSFLLADANIAHDKSPGRELSDPNTGFLKQFIFMHSVSKGLPKPTSLKRCFFSSSLFFFDSCLVIWRSIQFHLISCAADLAAVIGH